MEATTASAPELNLGRLRWQSRRALLELDLVLERFWQSHGERMSNEQAQQLARLLEMEDHDLWDVFCGRRELGDARLEAMIVLLRQT
jgi:antitoxin CptB